MAAGCLYVLEFDDLEKAVDVVYSREKKKEMEERLGLLCKMRVDAGKVKMVVVGEVGEDKFTEVVEDVFKLKVAKKERKEKEVEEGSPFLFNLGRDVFYSWEAELEEEEKERLNMLMEKIEEREEERKERSRSFHCLYYFEIYGKESVWEKMLEVCKKAKEAIGFEFAKVEEVKVHPVYGASTYSLLALLRAIDYEDARDIFSYGLCGIRDIIEEATGHQPVNIRIERIVNLSNWPPSIFK